MIAGSSAADAAAGAEQVVCPYLGLPDDPRTRFAFAAMAHRCYSRTGQKEIEITHQVTFCLGAKHPDCRRYVAPAPGALVALAPLARASVVRREGGRAPSLRVALLAVAVITFAIVGGWFLSQGGLVPAGLAGSPSASPDAGLASPSQNPQPAPSGSPRSSGAAPATLATPRPSSSPSRTTIHVVVLGDTLSTIADFYRVPMTAIQKANGITNPNLITVGQRLIIPAR